MRKSVYLEKRNLSIIILDTSGEIRDIFYRKIIIKISYYNTTTKKQRTKILFKITFIAKKKKRTHAIF